MPDDPSRLCPVDLDMAQELARVATPEALGRLRDLAELADGQGDHGASGRCSYLAARVSLDLGQLADALDLIDRARVDLARAGLHLEAARTDLGRMHVLGDLGRHHDAIEVGRALLERLPELDAQTGDAVARLRLEAAAHENIGVSTGFLGRHDDALAAYELAVLIYADAGLDADSVRCLANRGVELIELGRASEALEPLETAAQRFAAAGDRLAAAKCEAYRGRALLIRGDFLACLRALAESERLLTGQETTTEYARTQLARAEVLTSMNLVREGEELYDELEQRFGSSGLEHDRACALAGRARLLQRAGRTAAAGELYEQAELGFAAVGDRAMEAVCQVGRSFSVAPEQARALAARAWATLASLGRAPDELLAVLRLADLSQPAEAEELLARCATLLAAADVPELRWQVLHRDAQVLAQRSDLRGALALLDRAAAIIEQLRTTVVDERGRIPFLGTRRGVHEDAVDLCLRLGNTAAAYERTSSARARTLVERADVSAQRTARDVTAPVATADGAVEVTYEIIGEEVLAFVRTTDGLRVVRGMTTVASVDRLLRRLDAEWRRFDDRAFAARHAPALLTSTRRVLAELYSQLLGSVPALQGASSLLVIPAGFLANVPFHALHDGDRHLLERFPVGLAPTSRILQQLGGLPHPSRCLVLGVPDERAPLIHDEVHAIASVHPEATLLVGQSATTEALTRWAGQHDIIHLACHGLNRPDNPALSALRLSDGWLTALEIADLDLAGQLVVLSACASGRQDSLGNHDEMVGLPRAFLAAGACDVVVNLWRADDATANELMVDFHRRLQQAPTSVALREAQLDLMQWRPHPFLWAPTIAYHGPS